MSFSYFFFYGDFKDLWILHRKSEDSCQLNFTKWPPQNTTQKPKVRFIILVIYLVKRQESDMPHIFDIDEEPLSSVMR